MDPERVEQRIQTVCLLVLATVAGAAALSWLRPALVPFVLAVFVAFGLQPLVQLGVTRLYLPRALAIFATGLLSLLLLWFVGGLLSTSVSQMAANAGMYQARVAELIASAAEPLARVGIEIPDGIAKSGISGRTIGETLLGATNAVVDLLSKSLLVTVFVVFLLIGLAEPLTGTWRAIELKVQRYLITKAILSAATGFLVGLTLTLLDVDLALVFGLFAFLLNFIPSIGSVVATALPLPIVLMNPEVSGTTAVLAIAIPGAIQFTIGSVLEPKIMGDSLDLHPIAILIALIFWGMLWGIVGMLLAAPITAVMKILFERLEITQPLAGPARRPARQPRTRLTPRGARGILSRAFGVPMPDLTRRIYAAHGYVLLVALVLGSPHPVGAQTPDGDAFEINEGSGAGLVMSHSGDFLVTWHRVLGLPGPDNRHYFEGRLFGAGGGTTDLEFAVFESPGCGGCRVWPHMNHQTGGFLVVWEKGDGPTRFFRHYDAAGNAVGAVIELDGTYPEEHLAPDGGWIGTRQERYPEPPFTVWSRIIARRHDSAGNPVGAPIQINIDEDGWNAAPAFAFADDGSFTALWTGSQRDVPLFFVFPTRILGRRFDAAGAALGGEFEVTTNAPLASMAPHVVGNPDGSFVVAWRQTHDLDSEFGDYQVFGRRFAASATPLGPQFPISEQPDTKYVKMSLAASPGAGFVVSWKGSLGVSPPVWGLRARRFDESGNPAGGSFEVATTSSYQTTAYPAMGADRNFMIVWDEDGQVFGRSYFSALPVPLIPGLALAILAGAIGLVLRRRVRR